MLLPNIIKRLTIISHARRVVTTLPRTRLYHVSSALQTLDKVINSPFPDIDLPHTGTFTDHVFKESDRYSDRIALVDAISGRSHTFSDLQTATRKLGSGLARIGFTKGDVFAVYCPNSAEYFVAIHGVTSIGGTVTTINPLHTVQELSHHLQISGARYLLTVPAFVDNAKSAAKEAGLEAVRVIGQADGCIPFDSLLDNDASDYPQVDIDLKNDLAALPFSSGTTGLPKGVMLTHYNITSNLYQITAPRLVNYCEDDVIIGFMPMYHIYGFIFIAGVYPLQGVKTVLLQKFTPELFLDTIQKYKVTIAPIVPPVAVMMAKSPLVDQHDLSSLREIFCAAAPLSATLTKELKKRFPEVKVIRQAYGMTEILASHIMPNDVHFENTSVGLVVPNTQFKVVDIGNKKTLGAHENGEIWMRGPQVMKGYLKNPEATADTVDSDGWLHTGDIGYYDEQGYFFILDRLKELIKYKGLQVAPAELEGVLLTHPDVADAAVIGLEHDEAGEVPKAFVVRKGVEVTEEEIMKFVEQEVAPHKKLRGGVEFVEEIPKSASGKILRRILKERSSNRV